MRWSLLSCLLLVAPSVARADAIMPVEGDCPPGLERAIRDHAEACVPSACRTGHDCPSGSSCEILFECWAPRPVSSGRLANEEPRMLDRPIGPCTGEGHHCSEGACRERRQCEPTDETPAWDRRERHWTGAPHVASSGCSASAVRGSAAGSLLLFGLLATVIASRSRR